MEETKEVLIPVEKENRLQAVLEFCGELKEVKITTQQEYDNAVKLVQKVKTNLKCLEGDRKEIVAPFNAKVKEVNGKYSAVTDKLSNAEIVLKKAMANFFNEQERLRIEAQRKAEAEAAEARRLAEEKAAKEREKAEAYREQGKDDLAEKAEARADSAEMKAEQTVAPIIENNAKVSGVSYKTTYSASILDMETAVNAINANPSYRHMVSIDLKAIERLAGTLKGNLILPGIRIMEQKSVSVRS